jgi:hypothetical protein
MNALPDELCDDTDPPSPLSSLLSPPPLRASPSNETLCLILPPDAFLLLL